jgi:GTPase SAR1 family protein
MYQVNVLEVHQEEEYKGLTVPVYRIASCVILCCDLSDGKSLDELANFVELIRNIRQDCYTPMIISVNKSDLGLTGHPLSLEQVEMFAAMHNIGQVITTSALDNTNVKKAFEQVVVVLSDPVTMNPDWIKKLENGISILDQPKKKKKCAVM